MLISDVSDDGAHRRGSLNGSVLHPRGLDRNVGAGTGDPGHRLGETGVETAVEAVLHAVLYPLLSEVVRSITLGTPLRVSCALRLLSSVPVLSQEDLDGYLPVRGYTDRLRLLLGRDRGLLSGLRSDWLDRSGLPPRACAGRRLRRGCGCLLLTLPQSLRPEVAHLSSMSFVASSTAFWMACRTFSMASALPPKVPST